MDFIQQESFASPANRIELWALQAKRQDTSLLNTSKSRGFCQQEELGRKCPSVQCNVQSPLVLTCSTRGFMVDMQNEIQRYRPNSPHPACIAMTGLHIPRLHVSFGLSALAPCFLAEFPQQTLQHDHNRAICSLPGSLPRAARGEPHKASRSPGAFVRKWEPIRAPREAFHGVREQPSVTSVWVVWGGEPFTRCVHSSHRGEWLQAVWLMRVGMCNCLGEGNRLDCCTGYQACICRRKDSGNCFQGQTDMAAAHWDARALQPCGRQRRRRKLQAKAEVECDRWRLGDKPGDKGRMEAVGLHTGTFLSFRTEMASGQNCPVGYCCHRSQHTGLCGPTAWGEGHEGRWRSAHKTWPAPELAAAMGRWRSRRGRAATCPQEQARDQYLQRTKLLAPGRRPALLVLWSCQITSEKMAECLGRLPGRTTKGEHGWFTGAARHSPAAPRSPGHGRQQPPLPTDPLTPFLRAQVLISAPAWIPPGWLSSVANSPACTFERPFWRKNRSRLHLIVLLSLQFPLVCPWLFPTAKIPSPNRNEAAVISIG